MTELDERFRAVIEDLDPGEVVSYGEVARRAGRRGAARAVGAFLSRDGSELPWWRVVRADGRLASHKQALQAHRLSTEGVEVSGCRVLKAMPPR